MVTYLKGAGRYLLVVATVLLLLLVLSQVAQLVALASTLHPAFGTVTAVVLTFVLAGLVAAPLVGFLRLEPALVPPAQDSGPELETFVQRYLRACRRNPLLGGMSLETEEDLLAALKVLDAEAEKVVTQTASRVFLGTAVSQYGSLDTLVVAFTQFQMVWRIAHVFQQRPSPRQIGYLYANVLGTAAASSQLDRVDLAQHVQPVLSSVMGQTMTSIPGMSSAAGFVSNALFQGSVNAFLTLRVGMVAIEYCRATVRPVRRTVWKSAEAKAAGLLARTVATGTTRVTKAFVEAAARSVAGAATSVAGAVVKGGQQVGGAVVNVAGTVGSAATQAGSVVTAPVRRLRRRMDDAGAGSVTGEPEEERGG